jgi:hypothetical protein
VISSFYQIFVNFQKEQFLVDRLLRNITKIYFINFGGVVGKKLVPLKHDSDPTRNAISKLAKFMECHLLTYYFYAKLKLWLLLIQQVKNVRAVKLGHNELGY